MSSYFSSKRRFSRPEEPQPRFEWRMRVHSLMMDDNDTAPSVVERRVQRYDYRRASGESSHAENDQQERKSGAAGAVSEPHRHWRERLQRTKSEGHLKVRLRLSKFSETSKSLDQEETGADLLTDTSQESEADDLLSESRAASLQSLEVQGHSSPGDLANIHSQDDIQHHDARAVRPHFEEATVGIDCDVKPHFDDATVEIDRDVKPHFNDATVGIDRDVSSLGLAGACYVKIDNSSGQRKSDDESVDGSPEISDKSESQVYSNSTSPPVNGEGASSWVGGEGLLAGANINASTGAIPKTHTAPPKCLTDSPGFEKVSDSADEETDQENSFINIPKSPKGDEVTREVKHILQKLSDAENSSDPQENRWTSTVYNVCKELPKSSSENVEGAAGWRKSSSEDKGDMDDIEAIIEQIIAEEEAMVDGKAASAGLMRAAVDHMSEREKDALHADMSLLQQKVDDCNYEAENGVDIMSGDQQMTSQSSSLPSYHHRRGSGHIQTVLPYSSSCPSHQGLPTDDVKNEEEEEEDLDSWAYLPVILIEDIFTLLTPKERHQASMVCRQWYELFYSPRVWETFILLERTLTKKRFNLYKGYQRELCPSKTQLCFRRVGSFFKRIVVTPITDYFNLYEFLRILAAFLQFKEDHGQNAMPLLHTFDFTFACASRSEGVEMVHGTGGQILEMIEQLLVRMSNLKHLKLNQLLVDVMDVAPLFDAITNCFGESLSSLEMLNVTKVPLALVDLARFRNLIKLSISPQHLNDEVLLLISGLNILQLHLLQDPYTCDCEPVSSEAWKLAREMAPWMCVYLEVSGLTRAHVLIQPRAPVHGVFLRTPYSRVTNEFVMSLVENYSKTLRYFVQERLPRFHGPRGFHYRSDSSLLFLLRRCPALHTLVIRDRISTSSLILLASEGRRLSTFLVRKNGLIKRCDWPQCGEMSKEFYAGLREAALDYDKCKDKICSLLQRRWRPLTDQQFMRIKIVPRMQLF